LISRLSFAAPFVYSTRGVSDISERSRLLRDRIKRGDQGLIAQIADHVGELVAAGAFADFFVPEVGLVPVPGHAPLAPGAVGTTQRIALSLLTRQLAAEVVPLLERHALVSKSAFSRPADRPRAGDHYRTLRIRKTLLIPRRVLLVDDFVTRGATLIGAASRIAEELPDVEVRAFALVRSITEGEIAAIRDPCEGWIELATDGETRRRP
jgi:hypothetical protein